MGAQGMTITYTISEEIVCSVYRPYMPPEAKPGETIVKHVGENATFTEYHSTPELLCNNEDLKPDASSLFDSSFKARFDDAMCRYAKWPRFHETNR